ncbi:hypothetical protein LC1Hm_0429 [Halomicrobium sp. LC1Hm]|nr:hypothetical protein LC1Hm_0429 [Halomicrobium sp. LC1Hm]
MATRVRLLITLAAFSGKTYISSISTGPDSVIEGAVPFPLRLSAATLAINNLLRKSVIVVSNSSLSTIS